MKEQNKYIKMCEKRRKKQAASLKYRILDPVDRAKRFLVIIHSILEQLLADNNTSVVQRLEKVVLALDIYDIAVEGRVSPSIAKYHEISWGSI